MTLHEAMKTVLAELLDRSATTASLADEIAKRNLYKRKDGQSATASQINARARKYPNLFAFADRGVVRLL